MSFWSYVELVIDGTDGGYIVPSPDIAAEMMKLDPRLRIRNSEATACDLEEDRRKTKALLDSLRRGGD